MDIPGYDEWKLASPDDEPRDYHGECPFCGSGEGQGCLLEDDCDEDEHPPCYAFGRYEERDPDQWREEREEAKRDREMDR